MGNITIDGIELTLFYDEDQLKNGLLSQLSDNGKIEWFRNRMDFIFLEPMRRLFNTSSKAHLELNSSKDEWIPLRYFLTSSFSILLNGIESLGSFLTTPTAKNRKNFYTYIEEYMKYWDSDVEETNYNTNKLKKILWQHFRNGIAHGFVIEGGGLDYSADETGWLVVDKRLLIGPRKFFDDFISSIDDFFDDINDNESAKRVSFLTRFNKLYPS